LIDKRLGPYRITEEIGAGGMATVYRAYQPSMDRHVAIKVIRGHALADPTMRDRFRREARLIARLEHPHLLPVYDFDGDHDPPFIVMRYLEGGTLRQVQARGALPPEEILYTLGQIASALDYAHRQGVVHRDLKPSNVMIDREGNAFVTDFGIARVSDAPEQLTGTGHLIGTPTYMAPEQARALPDVDGAADRYALGVIAIELLAGSVPFHHESGLGLLMAHLNEDVPSATRRNPMLPIAVDQVLRTAMAKDRAARYPSGSALVSDLARALKTRSSDAPAQLQQITQVLSLDQLKAFEEKAKGKKTAGNGETPPTPTPSDQQRQMTAVSLDAGVLAEMLYAAGLDADGVRVRLEALWTRFEEIAREAGGVIQSRNDEVGIALWGRARLSEDDPERAIRATLRMRDAALEEARRLRGAAWNPTEEDPLPFAAGVTTGPILLERTGETGTYTVSGAAITVAGRVREAALPGEILVAHDTFTQVRGVFSTHAHEPLRLRGRKDPLDVYLVSAAKPRAFRLKARGIEGVETRMIGREIELRLLEEALTLTMEDGETQVVTVVGDAGVGKSRLLYEFSNHLELRDEIVWLFEARATQPSMVQPFSLTRDLFSFRFEILDSDPLDVVHKKFLAGVASFMGEGSEEKAQLMGQLIGFDFSSVPAVAEALKDSESFRTRGLALLSDFFTAACRTNPVVLYIEDIHWADDRSLDLVNLLVRDNLKLPLFVLCMARPSFYERRPQWGEGQTFHERIQLEPLSHLSSRRLVRELLKKVPEVPAALRDLVVERADGNPFYIEELVRALIDDGVIVKGEPAWSVDETRLSDVRIPPTLTGVLQSRLDGLAPGLHQLLQRGSVVGRVFWDAAAVTLGRPAVDEDETQAMLEELRRREMILRREESGFAGTVEYVFRHAILRDVTYATIAPKQRRLLHRAVGDWLLEMGGERAREHTALIADHYEQAGENELAARQLIGAATAAQDAGALEEATSIIKRASDLVADATESPIRIEIEILRGQIQSVQGEITDARRTLEGILPAARKSPDRKLLAQLLGNLVRTNMYAEDWKAAQGALDEALPLVRELGDEVQLMFVLRQAGNLIVHDRAKAGPFLEESLALARKRGDITNVHNALNSLGNMYAMAGDAPQAIAHYQSVLDDGAAVQPITEFMVRMNLGFQQALLGDVEQGARNAEVGMRVSRAHGIDIGTAGNQQVLAFIDLQAGRDEEARRRMREVFEISRALGPIVTTLIPSCAVIELRRGHPDRALAWIGHMKTRPEWNAQQDQEYAFHETELRKSASPAEWEAAMAAGAALDTETMWQQVAEMLGAAAPAPAAAGAGGEEHS
jgi:class 3 adenylate cyclase/tRNA A-37 threonylcarbamoyl transferase component Bud32/tetratricopeptide (TPR) repeat protein